MQEFLFEYPKMVLIPSVEFRAVIKGTFDFIAKPPEGTTIRDSFSLTIEVPEKFPRDIPLVRETGGRIPRNGLYHVNSDNTLCLGSPLRLLLKLSKCPNLKGFSEECLIPHLYAVSHKLTYGGKLPFSELQHGYPGIWDDTVELLGLNDPKQARYVLSLLGMKKRNANKHPCPCGCGRRLGKCGFNDKLRQFRVIADRNWFNSNFNA